MAWADLSRKDKLYRPSRDKDRRERLRRIDVRLDSDRRTMFRLSYGARATPMINREVDHIESAWLGGDPPNAVLDYIPVEHFGDIAEMFVAIVRVTDAAEKSSLSMIVGPCGKDCAHEITTLPDTKEGLAIARTIAPIVLRTLFLSGHWHAGTFAQLETA